MLWSPAPMTAKARPRPLVLVILDGFGERAQRDDNAVRLARTPVLTSLLAQYPHTLIGTSGPDVGLPVGQMGNSEVGHLNFGAGRIALMDISRIDNAVHDGTLIANTVLADVLKRATHAGGRLHLFGLLSDGGVHSSMQHLLALVRMARDARVQVVLHAFLDGRDVLPGTAPNYIAEVERALTEGEGFIGTVAGRYWGMDRDNRWERVERSYRAIVEGHGAVAASASAGLEQSYAKNKTDEFVEPFVIDGYKGLAAGDVGLHFNFRPDRARELTRALAVADFDGFSRLGGRAPLENRYACMTTYDATFGLPVAFPKQAYANIFPELLARASMTQFRCAETEKYAHVTYFFNGGREEAFAGEDRKMLPSPKDVATYDEKPEMSASGVAIATVEAVRSGKYDFVLVNFANPDMVGHTGVLDAAIHAVEAVDAGVGQIVDAARAVGGEVLVTADHGNCELMRDPATGKPHTAHTLNSRSAHLRQRRRSRGTTPIGRPHLRRRAHHAGTSRFASARGNDRALSPLAVSRHCGGFSEPAWLSRARGDRLGFGLVCLQGERGKPRSHSRPQSPEGHYPHDVAVRATTRARGAGLGRAVAPEHRSSVRVREERRSYVPRARVRRRLQSCRRSQEEAHATGRLRLRNWRRRRSRTLACPRAQGHPPGHQTSKTSSLADAGRRRSSILASRSVRTAAQTRRVFRR